ncbi:hypothetical protein [Paenibacillus sp. GYB003]|uniref:hypothetical protein n=1 Tax=Paenibacillus sp. GYB003 TaxID=2994392 RepID=UPI002F96A2B3
MKAGRIVCALRDRSRPERFGNESERGIAVSIYYPIDADAEASETIGCADLFAPAADKALALPGSGRETNHAAINRTMSVLLSALPGLYEKPMD